jgi:CRP-like cAMP-binding protein/flavin-dependent dehydrogenase
MSAQGPADLTLRSGSRVGVIGGGPAGSLFSYFLLLMAERLGISLDVDIYEPRDFTRSGPAGCNMCGGIVSESMVQLLATEGINLPPTVVQRGIDSYVLHMDVGTVRIETPRNEKRIAAVHRGAGPRGVTERNWESFDVFLLNLAAARGATVIRDRVEEIERVNRLPRLRTKGGLFGEYDLIAGAIGVNSATPRIFEDLGVGYRPPKTARTFICELHLGQEAVRASLGNSMHVFLLNLPRLEFAALIPKGDCVTACLLGRKIDAGLVESFFNAPEVKRCLPPGWSVPKDCCRCHPAINVSGAAQPFADRLAIIGDSGVSRLYKDGIGGAYHTAKAAAKTAVFHGVSAEDFRRHYLPVCRALYADNAIGKIIFTATRLIQGVRVVRRGVLRMTSREQQGRAAHSRMSGVLWDTFTGSASYRNVFLRMLHPAFLGRLAYETAADVFPRHRRARREEDKVTVTGLGRIYRPGEVIVRQGETGDCMYVIQSGKVEVVKESGGKEIRLAELSEGDFFGEMAIFGKDVRSATVRPLGEARVLTVDRQMFLRKIHDDPSLAFRIMQRMSGRLRELNEEITRLTAERIDRVS